MQREKTPEWWGKTERLTWHKARTGVSLSFSISYTSSQAFREYLRKLPPDNTIPPDLTDEHVPLYIRRLEYYRLLYRPKQTESYWKKR
ncbi:hypothetical protein FPS94_23335 [Shigella sonnei]|nr:hypothetical protein [Shigella sonnei]